MEDKLLRGLTGWLMVFFGICCALSVFLPVWSDKWSRHDTKNTSLQKMQKTSQIALEDGTVQKTSVIEKKLGKRYIKIKKNNHSLLPVYVKDCYQKSCIEIVLYHLAKESIAKEDIRIYKNGECLSKNDSDLKRLQQACKFHYVQDSSEGLQLTITIPVNRIYGYILYEDEKNIYVDCRKPKEVYPHILVLDAGHGGKDTGTPACEGAWEEKDYNLDFVKRLERQLELEGWKLYLTRSGDTKIALQDRVQLANTVEADCLISIHCNSSDEDKGNGLEALYKTNQHARQSAQLAECLLSDLATETGMKNRGKVDGQSIYIIRKAKMPTVLLEMGFLTDQGDVSYLKNEKNREKMVQVICKSLKKSLSK